MKNFQNLLLSQNKNGNSLPKNFPLIYLPFHHQDIINKESNENNELQIFKMTKIGLKMFSNITKHTSMKQRPQTALKHSSNSLLTLEKINKKLFNDDFTSKVKQDDTTKDNTSWKNRSKTMKFSDQDAKSELIDNKLISNRRNSIEVPQSKIMSLNVIEQQLKRPKTAKKFETMHYLSPTKSSLALAPESIHLHPQFIIKSDYKCIWKPKVESMKNMKTVKTMFKTKSNSKRRKSIRIRDNYNSRELR